jgi:putative membrane protein
MKHKSPLVFAAAFLGIFALSLRLASGEQIPASGKPLDAEDTKFVVSASQDGETEVRLGGIAKERGTTADVKSFGAMMAGDHAKANAELKALCAKRGVQLPANLDADHQKVVDSLAKKTGTDFDSAYTLEMVKAHKNAVALFEGEAKSTTDADLKAFVETTLPVLKHHLEMAEALGKGSGK